MLQLWAAVIIASLSAAGRPRHPFRTAPMRKLFSPARISSASAGKITVVEVDEMCEVGGFDPNYIHTPGIYVQRIVEAKCEKRIEKITTREREV